MSPSFVEKHGLSTPARAAAAKAVAEQIERDGIEIVRLSFVDQHGILRGKTIVAAEVARLINNGLGVPSSLLLKDTSNRTVFAAFTPRGGVGIKEMEGAGDVLMIPDPTTFQTLPWAPHSGWMLCDLRFGSGAAVAPACADCGSVLTKMGCGGRAAAAGRQASMRISASRSAWGASSCAPAGKPLNFSR